MQKLDTQTLNWRSHAITNVGTVRSVNEDACLDNPDEGLWVVADGMGGHAAGDVASQMITESLAKVTHPATMSDFIETVEAEILGVNERLLALSKNELDNQTIGSTIVCLLAHGPHCAILWAGDSRAYRLRNGDLTMLMQEHTQAEELIEQGLIEPDQAESHPTFNILTRAVGAQSPLYMTLICFRWRKATDFYCAAMGLTKRYQTRRLLKNSLRRHWNFLLSD